MPTAKRQDNGAFTPRDFPLDPFNGENGASREPWSLDASKLPSDDELVGQRNIILVLGEPPLDVIEPLLHSPHLSSSLLILATSRAYVVPSTACPDVRVLRLGVSLASHESGASRLVAVLQWADRVGSTWRTEKSPVQVQELAEDGATAGYLTPPRRSSWFGTAPPGSSSAPPSPASSELGLGLTLTSSQPRSLSRASKRSSTMESSPVTNSTQRTFDALFNFLPPNALDRHLLKHAILVTTVARPFLTCADPEPPVPPKRAKRFSLRTRPRTPAPPPKPIETRTPAHIVHLVPPARSSLIRPLESFCLSFSFPSASSRSAPALGLLPSPIGGPGAAPRPYVMPPGALSDVLHVQRKWTVTELVLCGALDEDSESVDQWGVRRREGISLRSLAKFNRAWLNGVGDLVLDSSGTGGRVRVKSDEPAHPPRALSDQSLPARRGDPSRRGSVPPPALADTRTVPRPLSVAQGSPASRAEPYSWHVQPTGAKPYAPVAQPSTAHLRHTQSQSQTRRTSNLATSHPSTSGSSSSSHSHSSASTHRTVQAASPTWPTPPSSTSSSPSSSPELDTISSRKGAGMRAQEQEKERSGNENVEHRSGKTEQRNGKTMPTPSWDEKDGGSSKTAGSVKKRRGLFTWMKR